MAPPLWRWRSDFDKFVVTANFQRRGWTRWNSNSDHDWNVYWCNVHTCREIFSPENGIRLGGHQFINHFPNHYELTRKDLLVKNVKRYRKECLKKDLERDRGGYPSLATNASNETHKTQNQIDFLPPTFTLPNEYALFAEAFGRDFEFGDKKREDDDRVLRDGNTVNDTKDTKQLRGSLRSANTNGQKSQKSKNNSTWIVKPVGKAQGKGIFLINSLAQVKKWAHVANYGGVSAGIKEEKYVVSKYLDDPLLIGGKKFDLRMYVVVTNFRPLVAYVSRLGFARFCVTKYTSTSSKDGDLEDLDAHLTNVAVQKKNADYNSLHGGKWGLDDLRLFLESQRGFEATDALFKEIDQVILKSLRSVQHVIHNSPRCFELYGYDLLIDEELKPWLIEVNASPSLSATTEDDRDMKLRVIRNALLVAVPDETSETKYALGKNAKASRSVGCLDLLVDDSIDVALKGNRNAAKGKEPFVKR
tara:strand:+ start:30149 stop:31570 length:1422 start_codon:yes stop_codon:yes gene_type:complete